MVVKSGRYGRFAACPNYPACKNTKPLDKDGAEAEEEKKPVIADFKCELCGGDMVLRTGRYGSFYACVNYPKCKFTKQRTKDIGVACPKCGAKIVSKIGRNRTVFYSCERYPDWRFFLMGYADRGNMPAVRQDAVSEKREKSVDLS